MFAGLALAILAALAPTWMSPSSVPANFGDLYAYHYPLRHLTFSALQSGRLPFWNPYIFAGLPLAANPQSVLFYPGALLGAFFPLTVAFSWDYALHLIWAGLGCVLLARSQRLSSIAALLLAGLYVFSPFLIYRIAEGIPTLLASLSWAPWCWLAWFSGRPGWLAGAWSLQFFSGHPQFMAINALAMAVWALLRRERAEALRRLLREGLPVAMLTAVQWMPLWEFMGRSLRQSWPEAFTTAYSLDPSALWTWLRPGALGNPLEGTYSGPPSVFFETAAVHIGLTGLFLACLGLRNSARPLAAASLAALGIFLALGGRNPLYLELLRHSPLGLLRTPARYLFLSLWGLWLAAGAGAQSLERRGRPGAGLRALVVAAAALELLSWDWKFLRAQDARPFLRADAALARSVGGAPSRLLTDPDLANPNKAMLYRAMNINGYEAFYLAGFAEYAARSEGRPAADASRSYLRRADTPEMKRLGVSHFLSSEGQLQAVGGALPLAYFIDESGSPLGPPPSLSIERAERWLVGGRTPAQARKIILAQAYYPGWRAWLNGTAVALSRWDGFLQSLELPPASAGGSVELALDFRPTGWPLWAFFSAASWAAWLGLWSRRARISS